MDDKVVYKEMVLVAVAAELKVEYDGCGSHELRLTITTNGQGVYNLLRDAAALMREKGAAKDDVTRAVESGWGQ